MLILILVFSSALPWLTRITLVEPILKLLLLHVAQPFVLCNWYAYCLIYLLALVVCFYSFWGSNDPILCTCIKYKKLVLVHKSWGASLVFDKILCCLYHNIFYSCGSKDHMIVCSIWYLLIACLYFLYVFVAYDPFICNLWVLNIVCFPPTTYHCIFVFLGTHLLWSTHFLEDHQIYWLSKLLVHFGDRCQWGRSIESLLWIWLAGFAFIA